MRRKNGFRLRPLLLPFDEQAGQYNRDVLRRTAREQVPPIGGTPSPLASRKNAVALANGMPESYFTQRPGNDDHDAA
jgi:hypothetical protein